jgi:hypothetical protein
LLLAIEKEKLGLVFLKLLSDTFPSNRRTPDGSSDDDWVVAATGSSASASPKVREDAACLAALIPCFEDPLGMIVG